MARRPTAILATAYVFLLLYASWMPFDVRLVDARDLWAQWDSAWRHWPFTGAHASRTDLLSNVLLYVPLGVLLGVGFSGRSGLWRLGGMVAGTLGCTTVSALVETGQVFLASRVPSGQDLLSNTAGGFLGALMGAGLLAPLWGPVGQAVGRWSRLRPAFLPACLLAGMLVADALFPWVPTLDVSTVKGNVQRSVLSIHAGLALHPWHRWLVQRALVWGALTALTASALARPGRRRCLAGALLCGALALVLEGAKPLILTRSANLANPAVSLAAVLAVALICAVPWRLAPRRVAWLVAVGIAGYLAYCQWLPFRLVASMDEAIEKIPHGASWLPLYHHARRAHPEDARRFGTFLLLAWGWATSLAWAIGRRAEAGIAPLAVASAAALGLLAEGSQFIVAGRSPTTSDVLPFVLGGALSAWTWRRVGPADPAPPADGQDLTARPAETRPAGPWGRRV